MFKPFRSLIVIVLVVSLFFASPSRAFDPLSFTAFVGYSLLAHGGVAGLYYYIKYKDSSVDSVGTISKDAKVQWIDAKDIQVKSKDIKAKLPYEKVKAATAANPSKYPNLKAKTVVSDIYTETAVLSGTPSSNVGKKITISGTTYVIGAFVNTYSSAASCNINSNTWRISNGYIYNTTWSGCGGSPGTGSLVEHKWYIGSGSTAPVYSAATPAQFAKSISVSGDSGPVADLYQDELDKMFNDPDYVPVFTDATTGLPYAPPAQSDVMTPGQVDTYNKVGAAKEAAQAAAASAGQAATNAGNAYTASGGDLSTGTGGDASLYQKYLDAKAAADKAAADAAETESDKTDNSAYEGSFDNSAAYGDQSKDFEFGTRFQAFFNEMKNTSLFSLPNQFLGDIPSSSTSSMTIQGGRFGSFTYDFAQFNGLFVVIKSILLVLFSWVSARIVMLKGGGG